MCLKRLEKKVGDGRHARGRHQIGDCWKREWYMDNSTKKGEGRRLVTYKFLKRRGRTAWEARVSGRCRKAPCAPRARPAQEFTNKGAGARCGLGEGCGAEGVGVHYV